MGKLSGLVRSALCLLCGIALASTLAVAQASATTTCSVAAVQAAETRLGLGITIGTIDDGVLPTGAPTSTINGALDVAASDGVPEYCVVTGSVVTNSATGKTANFEFILPASWNGKFLFSGCGGLCDAVLPGPTEGIVKGYAIASTDDGHAAHDGVSSTDRGRCSHQASPIPMR